MATTISGDNGIDKVANGTVDLTTDVTGVLPQAQGGTGASSLPSSVTSLNGQTGAITNTSLYAIGGYITGRPQNNNTDYQVDSTIAGSSLYTTPTAACRSPSAWNSVNGGIMAAGVALINTGTWRCVSPALRDTSNNFGLPGLWVRIS
jgi:hypothetical protein